MVDFEGVLIPQYVFSLPLELIYHRAYSLSFVKSSFVLATILEQLDALFEELISGCGLVEGCEEGDKELFELGLLIARLCSHLLDL